jgi:glucokinase
MAAVSIEVIGGEVSVALVGAHARVHGSARSELPASGARSDIGAIARLVGEVARGAQIAAIGVAVPGHVDPETSWVTDSGRAGWRRFALRELLSRELALGGLLPSSLPSSPSDDAPAFPFVVVARRAAAVAAEAWAGAATGLHDVVCLLLDGQVEAGLLIDGHVRAGAMGRAGEAGWLALSHNYREEYGRRGCLTVEAGLASFLLHAVESWSGETTSLLGHVIATDVSQLTPAAVVRAARAGDVFAQGIIEEVCRWIGRGRRT